MTCTKVEKRAGKELVSFKHTEPDQPPSALRVVHDRPNPGAKFTVEIRDAAQWGQFSIGVSYPLLVTS